MKIFIGTSSSENIDQKYILESKKLFEILFKNNDLVFGYCNKSIMGLSYEITKKYNNNVIGSLPKKYDTNDNQVICDEKYVSDTMMESTIKLFEESDILIILPGGFGTLYELASYIQSKICDDYNKKIIIYNMFGYYDKLLDFFDNMYNEKFATPDKKKIYTVVNTLEEVLNEIDK